MKVKNYNIEDLLYAESYDFDNIVDMLDLDDKLLDSVIKLSLSKNDKSWRACWILYHYCERKNNFEMLQKYSDDYINIIKNSNHNGYIRETIKIIKNFDFNERQISEMYDHCLILLYNNKYQSSVRAVAFDFLLSVSKTSHELTEEVITVFNDIKEYLSPGIKQSMINKIEKLRKEQKSIS